MAHMSQETKKDLAPGIKSVLTKYGMKGTISVRHMSTLIVTLQSGSIDLFGAYNTDREQPLDMEYFSVNPYYIKEHFPGVAGKFLTELKHAMMIGNHDRSDSQTDYFDVGWYVEINVGRWNKPYQLTK